MCLVGLLIVFDFESMPRIIDIIPNARVTELEKLITKSRTFGLIFFLFVRANGATQIPVAT